MKDDNRKPLESKMIIIISAFILLQIALGIATVMTERLPYIASFHVVVGAALLGSCVLLVFISQSNKLEELRF